MKTLYVENANINNDNFLYLLKIIKKFDIKKVVFNFSQFDLPDYVGFKNKLFAEEYLAINIIEFHDVENLYKEKFIKDNTFPIYLNMQSSVKKIFLKVENGANIITSVINNILFDSRSKDKNFKIKKYIFFKKTFRTKRKYDKSIVKKVDERFCSFVNSKHNSELFLNIINLSKNEGDIYFYLFISKIIKYLDKFSWEDKSWKREKNKFDNKVDLNLHFIIQTYKFSSENLWMRTELLKLLADRMGIESTVVKKFTQLNKPKLKIALCISGQIRFENWEKILEKIKRNIVDPLEADVFFSTWDFISIHPTVNSNQIGGMTNPFRRSFRHLQKITPSKISTENKFKELLPNVHKKFRVPDVEKPTEIDKIEKVFGESLKNLNIISQEFFEKEIDKPSYSEKRKNNNMSKMAFLNHDVIESVPDNYDIVIKIRPDYPPKSEIKYETIESILEDDSVGIFTFDWGMEDSFYISSLNNAKKIGVWTFENAIRNNGFYFEVNDEKVLIYNHLMVAYTFIKYNISVNKGAAFEVNHHSHFDIHTFKVPEFYKELNFDLNHSNLTNDEKNELMIFFDKVPTYKIASK